MRPKSTSTRFIIVARTGRLMLAVLRNMFCLQAGQPAGQQARKPAGLPSRSIRGLG
jgi:hypothetical protein